MHGAPVIERERWARRWLASQRDLPPVPAPVHDLLAARLAARRHAFWVCSPLLGLALVVLVAAFPGWPGVDETGPAAQMLLGSPMFVLCLAGYDLATATVTGRAEKVIAADLPRCVVRQRPVPLSMVLGRSGMALAAAGFLLPALPVAAAFSAGLGMAVWARFVITALACALYGINLHRTMARPTVAVDGLSLAIDERLRWQDTTGALRMLPVLLLGWPPTLTGPVPETLFTGSLIASTALFGLSVWVQAHPPWQATTPDRRVPPVIES